MGVFPGISLLSQFSEISAHPVNGVTMKTQKTNPFKEEVRLFFTALMFFTRIPVPAWIGFSETYLNHAARYFSLVGIVVGVIGAGVFWSANLVWPLPIAVLLSMIATILATGAFHEDGFADSCDGFGGGWTTEKVLDIMKDSRIGTYGAVGIGLVLATKFFSLTSLDPRILPAVIIAGHTLSRYASATFIFTQEYVRADLLSKAKPLANKMSLAELGIATVFGLLPLFLLPGRFWLLLIPVFAARWLAGRYFYKRIGGYTGDCLGAAQQVTEAVFYLFAVALGNGF